MKCHSYTTEIGVIRVHYFLDNSNTCQCGQRRPATMSEDRITEEQLAEGKRLIEAELRQTHALLRYLKIASTTSVSDGFRAGWDAAMADVEQQRINSCTTDMEVPVPSPAPPRQ